MSKIFISLLGLGLALGSSAIASDRDTDSEQLAAVLAAQSEEMRSRYVYRNPQETLTFLKLLLA